MAAIAPLKSLKLLVADTLKMNNRKYSNGWIEAFSDTEQNLRDMGSMLRENNMIAVCIPERRSQNVFVAYWGASPQFQFFNESFAAPSDSVCLIARDMLGPIERLKSHNRLDDAANLQLSTMLRQASEVTRLPLPEKPLAQPLSRADTEAEDDNYDGVPMDVADDDDDHAVATERSISPAQGGPAAPQPAQTQGQLNIRDVFLQNFSMTFQKLATFGSNAANEFYLLFPESESTIQQEFELLCVFLKEHKARVFSNRTPADWTSFSKVSRRGAVIFHSSYENYYELPNLHEMLSKQCNFWRASLRTPLRSTQPTRHFERIFPHGGVILITEDFMVMQPEATTIILDWFHDNYVKGRFPGHWKLMVRPHALTWLLQKHDKSEGDEAGR